MATVKGVNKTKIDNGGLSNMLDAGYQDGRVKVALDTYEASALASGSLIEMCGDLPQGARIIDVILTMDATINANIQLLVGDSTDDDRYIDATGSAAVQTVHCEMVEGFDYVIGTASADSQIIVKTTGLSAATGTLKLVVLYSTD